MKHVVSIALALVVAATFGSASWAGDNGKAKGSCFGQVGDASPKYALKPNSGEPHDLEPLDHT